MLNIGRDLKSKWAIYLKAVMFIVVLSLAIALNLVDTRLNVRLLSVGIIIWASARLYYFMFYVIERYVDSEFRFSSVYSFLVYLLDGKK